MTRATQHALVLVTAPDIRTARRLAGAALNQRLVACANLWRGIESRYWWKGAIESGTEVLLLFKTTVRRLAALEKFIVEEHPYDTPEFVVFRVEAGNRKYLDWLSESVRPPRRRRTR